MWANKAVPAGPVAAAARPQCSLFALSICLSSRSTFKKLCGGPLRSCRPHTKQYQTVPGAGKLGRKAPFAGGMIYTSSLRVRVPEQQYRIGMLGRAVPIPPPYFLPLYGIWPLHSGLHIAQRRGGLLLLLFSTAIVRDAHRLT